MKIVGLDETVLLFEKHNITEDQIISHVRHYVELAEKGLELIDSNKQEAMSYLKEIRRTMTEEYKYYSRSKVQSIMWSNPLSNKYHSFITEAFAKQNSPNSYRTLSSNLYDVKYYGRYHFRKYLIETEEDDL